MDLLDEGVSLKTKGLSFTLKFRDLGLKLEVRFL